MVSVLLTLLVGVAIVGILYWAITQIPLPAPARIVGVVVIAIAAIWFLMNYVMPLAHG